MCTWSVTHRWSIIVVEKSQSFELEKGNGDQDKLRSRIRISRDLSGQSYR
jgi:hypothetical protein